ncbi:hypothetical protein HYQ44_010088 [Verticillium longisporum]|nr:hypothetical protein HYQ44_010088 [Verticillium longisporum]
MDARKHRDLPLLSRRQVEGLIASGRTIIIVDNYVLKVDAWLKYHPGGDKAIMHMVGRDATDEVTVLHSPEAREQMMRYRIGRVEGRWENFLPPIQGGSFRDMATEAPQDEEQTSTSSDTDSREASPVFDAEKPLAHRRYNTTTTNTRGHSSSASSVSSHDDDHKMTPTGFLDAQTKKEISLDLDRYPSLDINTQHEIVVKYRLLNKRIQAEGLYDCNYLSYAIEMVRYSLLFSGMLLFLSWGHMGITHNFHIDTCIGIFIADFLDIEHMPFFAVSHRLLGNLYSTYYDRLMKYDAFAKVMLSVQSKTYYPIMLFGRFNLYVLSWDHLIAGRVPRHGPAWWHRWLEVVGQAFFWAWFGYGIVYRCIPTAWDRVVFVIVSHMLQAPLHIQITLSHFAMSTADLGPAESFPQKMLRTTMDVDCPTWLDFFHGGLQFQAIHHLYPRIPRHNLRRTQKLVQEFCVDVGIPYALYGFVDGNKTVIGKLAEVSRQAAILAECQKHVASHE